MALLTTAETESLSAISGNVAMAPTSVASSVTFAVGGFVVIPSVGFAIAILLRRGGWRLSGCFGQEEFCIGVEGLVSFHFVGVVVPVLPHYLDD